jgi:transcriptional regulator with XRE-family HTH domain/SOS-response transcriptional repressor LexA
VAEPRTFADALKEARQAAGLSQAALARRAGLTGSYISVLESRRRPPPSPRVVRSLCRVLDIQAAPLLEAAALERSPPTVRRRLERMNQERGRVQKTRDRLLTTTLFHLSRRPRVVEPMAGFLDLPPDQQALLGRLLGRVRRARSLDEVESRADTILEDASPEERDALVRVLPGALGDEGTGPGEADAADVGSEAPFVEPVAPPSPATAPVHADLARRREPIGRRSVARDAWHAELFFWRVSGDDAHPRFEAGDLVLVDPHRAPAEGDVVVLRHDGRDRIGTYLRRGDEIQVVFPRPEVPPIRLGASRFRPAGVVIRLERDL